MKRSKGSSRLSKPIVVISLTSIILGIAIMIIASSVITGFQEGVRNKVIGFGSHIQVIPQGFNQSYESAPLLIDEDHYATLAQNENIRHIQSFGYKPAILQSYQDSVSFRINGQDTTRESLDIIGTVFKGVGNDHDWAFLNEKITAGRSLDFNSDEKEVIISEYIATKLGYSVGDRCEAFFIRDNSGPKKQKFTIVGIYNSGFEDFDKRLIFTSLEHIQKLNNWGVNTFLTLADTCINKQFVLKGIVSGGSQAYLYDWGGGYQRSQFALLDLSNTNEVRLIATDVQLDPLDSRKEINSIPDTAFLKLEVEQICECTPESLLEIEYIDYETIQAPFGNLKIENGEGTHRFYSGGFEIMLHDLKSLDETAEFIRYENPLYLEVNKITDLHPEIFSWLSLLDMNIQIIILLILVVSVINMITSLLVLILEKTNMIGILKAIGAPNFSIRKIFMHSSLILLYKGLFWGNLLGIGLLLFQYFTSFFTLDPEVYYLDVVPVKFDLINILFINGLTIITCLICIIIPSVIITGISPVKAIRFD